MSNRLLININHRNTDLFLEEFLKTKFRDFIAEYYQIEKKDISKDEVINFEFNENEYIRKESTEEEKINSEYTALINMLDVLYAKVLKTNGLKKITQNMKDQFHTRVHDFQEYVETFKNDPIEVKKIRIVQLINRLAHEYKTYYRQRAVKKLDTRDNEKRRIFSEVSRQLFDKNSTGVEKYLKNAGFSEEELEQVKQDKILECISGIIDWMFKEKQVYIRECLRELDKSKMQYSYGYREDDIQKGDALIFDVPQYGQFSIHMGPYSKEETRYLQMMYGLQGYRGNFLEENVFILQKADENLLQRTDESRLSDRDKIKYEIITHQLVEKPRTAQRSNLTHAELERLVQTSEDVKKSKKIVETIMQHGINPNNVVTKTVLQKGTPKTVEEIIQSLEVTGIGVEVLEHAKTLLSTSADKAIDIMEMVDVLNRIGVGAELLQRRPMILTTSSSSKMEAILKMMKEYKIELTDENLEAAFSSNAKNIRDNLDVSIENGVYDIARQGNKKILTMRNQTFRINANFLQSNHGGIITEKRKINSSVFLTNERIKERYGITSEQIFEELSKTKGQELVSQLPYSGVIDEQQEAIEKDEIALTDEESKMFEDIYSFIEAQELENGVVIQVGNYTYSAPKVKRYIAAIIASGEVKELDNEKKQQICRIALLKNKNLTDDEYNQIMGYEFKEIDIEKISKSSRRYLIYENNTLLQELQEKYRELQEYIRQLEEKIGLSGGKERKSNRTIFGMQDKDKNRKKQHQIINKMEVRNQRSQEKSDKLLASSREQLRAIEEEINNVKRKIEELEK